MGDIESIFNPYTMKLELIAASIIAATTTAISIVRETTHLVL